MTLGSVMAFWDTAPKAWDMKERIDKLDFIKGKNFCSEKYTVKWMKRQAADWWQKMFEKDPSVKGPLSRIYKDTKNS